MKKEDGFNELLAISIIKEDLYLQKHRVICRFLYYFYYVKQLFIKDNTEWNITYTRMANYRDNLYTPYDWVTNTTRNNMKIINN